MWIRTAPTRPRSTGIRRLCGPETVGEITRLLALRAEVTVAILYGSVLTERFADHSDVDLAVAADHELSYDDLFSISDELGGAVAREVQVRDLHRLQGRKLREVLIEGRVIKNEDPELFGRRIADMLDFTEDWLPSVRMIQEAAIRNFAYDE